MMQKRSLVKTFKFFDLRRNSLFSKIKKSEVKHYINSRKKSTEISLVVVSEFELGVYIFFFKSKDGEKSSKLRINIKILE